ncbi:DUF6492 family protein [Aneurinibacillus sp. Ricciae_BoGa-3]|uniref:DUF6492 family protein n=1 Tax=Aneurinibacillus sp. Ricciae_BoGa-3 TaxID=3022697 RepID=UPI002342805B|nr:DUF6492 family protein [Aneurinibacillus sp. Ricciae_BoGa-3]WCK54485.1 DUF6492 family protein [Aneurinibacillus sp. Ricciae_BoGa-3]
MSLRPNNQYMSRTKIDVLIPAIEKDLKVLPFVIDGVRKHVKHPIGDILIVSPNSVKIKQLCKQKNCKFINENFVLPITKKHINYRTNRWNRSGWLFQQFLKLSGDKLCSQKFYLVIDADTVLTRPHVFRQNEKTVFYCRGWSRPEYFKTYRKLLGRNKTSSRSFVTHYMLFEKAKVAKLKKAIETRHKTTWFGAILRNIDRSKQITFSEFETYGNFLHANFPGQLILKRALNKAISKRGIKLSLANLEKAAGYARSVSLHERRVYFKRVNVTKKTNVKTKAIVKKGIRR